MGGKARGGAGVAQCEGEVKQKEEEEKVEEVDAEGEAWERYSRLVERGVRNLRPLFFDGRTVFGDARQPACHVIFPSCAFPLRSHDGALIIAAPIRQQCLPNPMSCL